MTSWLLSPKPARAAPALPTPAEQRAVGAKATEDILKKYPQVKDAGSKNLAHRLVSSLPEPDEKTWDYCGTHSGMLFR